MNKPVDSATLKNAIALKSMLDKVVLGYVEEIGTMQRQLDASDERSKVESGKRSATAMLQFIAGCQALSHINYNAQKSNEIKDFKGALIGAKVPNKATKEITELGRHVINKAKKRTDLLGTKDGTKVTSVTAFQTWPRDKLQELLLGMGFETVTDIRKDKYPTPEWPVRAMKAITDRNGKKNDELIAFFAALDEWRAKNPVLVEEGSETETEDNDE